MVNIKCGSVYGASVGCLRFGPLRFADIASRVPQLLSACFAHFSSFLRPVFVFLLRKAHMPTTLTITIYFHFTFCLPLSRRRMCVCVCVSESVEQVTHITQVPIQSLTQDLRQGQPPSSHQFPSNSSLSFALPAHFSGCFVIIIISDYASKSR